MDKKYTQNVVVVVGGCKRPPSVKDPPSALVLVNGLTGLGNPAFSLQL